MKLDFLKRPEFVTLVAALIVTALSSAGVGVCGTAEVITPETATAPAPACIPQSSINEVVTVFWAVAVKAVIEGAYKGDRYLTDLKTVFRGSSFLLALSTFIGVSLNALVAPLGLSLSAETVSTLLNLVLVAIGLKAAGDVAVVVKEGKDGRRATN